MSNYNTLNPVPSIDPRDLDDNATIFDLLLQSASSSVPDRLGAPRKTWHQMELDAAALVSPNVSSLASLTLSADKGLYAVGAGALATYDLSTLGRTLGGIANAAAGRAALSAAASGANTDITSITGSAASLTTSRSITATGDATWTVNFNGTANATAAITLADTGVGAGTYGSVTVNAKGLVTAASIATPVANGGTGATTALAAGTALGVNAVGTNTDQLAKSSMIQNEIANKRTWTSYTPTITTASGAYTTVSATGSYMVVFGICYIRVSITVTTKGTGVTPTFTLPFAALSGSAGMPLLARENAVNGKSGAAFITAGLTTAAVAAYDNTDLVTADGCVVVVQAFYPVA